MNDKCLITSEVNGLDLNNKFEIYWTSFVCNTVYGSHGTPKP